mmetsp:Transcript_28037/g.52566  ORF Transcript_28037/g.52566 Transcript_28037/m.52566 type:complete len:431 (+) Transcript_28037:131-1423(+)
MAFAADSPASGLNKAMPALNGEILKDAGTNGWRKPVVKEDGSVSNSSSTNSGCEPSVCEESEATKVARDGSGSSSGSRTETVKAYKESTQDESSSSASRSEQAQDVQDNDAGKQLNSLKTAGPIESVGSVGHPNNCKPCAFYCFSLCGCRMDRDCAYCHLFHQSRLKQRREEWKRAQRMRRGKQKPGKSEEVATASVQRPGAILRDPEGASMPQANSFNPMAPPPKGHAMPAADSLPPGLPQGSVEPPAANPSTLEGLIQQVSLNTALLRSLLPMLSSVPAAQNLTSLLEPLQAESAAATMGAYASGSSMVPPPMSPLQDSNLPEGLLNQTSMDFFEYKPSCLEVFVGQMVELWPPVSHLRGCIFAVAPRLPLGVTLDERSGLLHGRPQEPTQGQVNYFITACNPTRFPPTVSVALIKLTVNYAFDVWPH